MSVEEAYRSRHHYRRQWYEIGKKLREGNPGVLLRKCLAHGDIAAGIRDLCELEYAVDRNLVDWVLWIDRPGFDDPTLEFTIDNCIRLCEPGYSLSKEKPRFGVIKNNRDLKALHSQLKGFCLWQGIRFRGRE